MKFEISHLNTAKQKQQIEGFKEPLKQSVKDRIGDLKDKKQRLAFNLAELEGELDAALINLTQQIPISLNIPQVYELLAMLRSDRQRPNLLNIQAKVIKLLDKLIQQPAEDSHTKAQPESEQKTAQPKANYQFNRLYQQEVNPQELLEEATKIPNILLVEDDTISMQLTKMLLSNYNANIEAVSNGRLALAQLKEKKFDLVLMDVNLPDTNGIYLIDQTTTNLGPNKETPLVVLSGNKNKSVVAKAMERGAKGYVLKPLHKPTADKLFNKFINRNKSSKH